ncbi:MAG: hypothetical protein ACK4GQ_03950 [Candidatus Hadarchaeales archaeon]
MNEIVKYLKTEHELALREMTAIEKMLLRETNVWKVLERLVKLVENLWDHFNLEKETIYAELDKLPRKFPLKFSDMEADDWERIISVARKDIWRAVEYREEKIKNSAIRSAKTLIEFMKKHFALEEELIFPAMEKLTEEQKRRILCVLTEISKVPWGD